MSNLNGNGDKLLPHHCDERCICPEHGTQLIYAPSVDDHTCQDCQCRYGHGVNAILIEKALDWLIPADVRRALTWQRVKQLAARFNNRLLGGSDAY